MRTFEVLPAIDLRGGKCVRLTRGDFAREKQYGDDPVAMAQRWEAEGGSRLHVVDLDGAARGSRQHGSVIGDICRALSIPVQVGGGLRDLAALLYGLYDVDAPKVASPKPVGGLAASPATKARVLEESWCHAEIYAAARKLPAFVAFS